MEENWARFRNAFAFDQLPYLGTFLEGLRTVSGFFSSAKDKLAEESAEWKKSLKGMDPEVIRLYKDLFENQKEMLNEEEEKKKFDNLQNPLFQLYEEIINILNGEKQARIAEVNKNAEHVEIYVAAMDRFSEKGADDEQKVATEKKPRKAKLLPIEVWSRMPTPEYAPIVTPRSLFGGVSMGPQKISTVPTTPLGGKEAKATFKELTAGAQAFQDSFTSGLNAVQAGIQQGIGGAFHKMFGEANSILEMFVQNFVTSLAKMALKSTLLSSSAITLVIEPKKLRFES